MTDGRDTSDGKRMGSGLGSTMTGNYLCVAGGLQILKTVLAPYVARELRAQFSDEWWRRGVLEVLHENQRRKFPVSDDDAELIRSLDVVRCLLVMGRHWNDLFQRKLSDDHRTWLEELISTLTRWVHVEPMAFAGEEVRHALDTMGRFVEPMDAGAAERIRALARTVRFRNAGGSAPAASEDSPRSPDERRRPSDIVPESEVRGTEAVAAQLEVDQAPANPGASPPTHDERSRPHGIVPESEVRGIEGVPTQHEVGQGPGPLDADRSADGEIARPLPSGRDLAATIRSSAAIAAATQRSETANLTPTIRSGDGSAPRTVISGTRPATTPGEDRLRVGLHGWFPTAIGTTMRIVEPLPTRGAEADLYIVEDMAGTRHVAKIYRYGVAPKADVLDRIREARAATHVVRLEDYGVEDGRWWELLEYVEHGCLRGRLTTAGGVLPETDVRRVLAQLADGLDSLHAIGLEHRDLKPENVLVRRSEPLEVVIADWGIASLLEATVHFTAMARTIRYAPPEAIGHVVTSDGGTNSPVSAIERTHWDAWSLGMMVVEMKTGVHPFEQVSDQVVGHRLATQSVDALCEHVMDPAWRRLCRGLLRRQPTDRWGTAEVRCWLANPDDTKLTVADDQPVRGHAGIDFDGRHFTDRRALGRGLQQADQAKAESFWRRRFRDLRTWITDTLGEDALGEALEEVARDPNLSLGEQVFCCIHLLWPEAPIVVDDVLIREDVLHETARRAWAGDEEAASQLVRVAANPRVELAAGLDASGVVDWMHKAWRRAADHYTSGSRILAGQDLAIPEWRNAEYGTPDQTIEVETVAGVEIGVDTVTGAPQLPARMQAGVLGAAIGETTCTNALRTMAERVADRWEEVEPLLAEMRSHGAANPALLVAAIYGALEVQKRENEAAQYREAAERPAAREVVWRIYGTATGLFLSVMLSVLVELELEPSTAWMAWIYLAIAVLGAISGSILGKRMENSATFRRCLAPPVGEPGTAQNWQRRHEARANSILWTASVVLFFLMIIRWVASH